MKDILNVPVKVVKYHKPKNFTFEVFKRMSVRNDKPVGGK